MNIVEKLLQYNKAAYTGIFVMTHEEERLCQDIRRLSDIDNKIKVFEWDTVTGLSQVTRIKEEPVALSSHTGNSTTSEVKKLLNQIRLVTSEHCIYVLKDFHLHFDKVDTIRQLRNLWNFLSGTGSMIIFVGHKFVLPGELLKEVQLLDYDLPKADDIKNVITYIHRSGNEAREKSGKQKLDDITDDIMDASIEAAKGMTFFEIENAVSYAASCAGGFNSKFVAVLFDEKIAQLKKSGKLTYMKPDIGFDSVGGMEGLKKWLSSRKKAYSKEAREFNLPLPKGMLLASVPGTGKSLICKAIAREFDCPLFALDIGSIFGSLVGSSEANMREIIKTIESIGKCVILIDEIEKSLSNSAVSGQGDSGVGSRVFGTFLTWLNDRNNPAFIVATTNNHTILPPALIRKGRFDQLFWVDLPSAQERKEIFEVVIRKYKRDPENFAIRSFVTGSENFTGAEIEEVFKDAMYKAFDNGEEVNDSHVMDVLAEFIPFAVSHEEDLEMMRKHAQGKLVMVNNQGNPIADVQKKMRKLSIAIGE